MNIIPIIREDVTDLTDNCLGDAVGDHCVSEAVGDHCVGDHCVVEDVGDHCVGEAVSDHCMGKAIGHYYSVIFGDFLPASAAALSEPLNRREEIGSVARARQMVGITLQQPLPAVTNRGQP